MTKSLEKKIGIPEKWVESLRDIFRQTPSIDRVVVYGSPAKGNYRPGSDIDLAIFSASMNFIEQMNLENAIDDLLMPYSVDITRFEQLTNQALIEHINRVGIRLYSRD